MSRDAVIVIVGFCLVVAVGYDILTTAVTEPEQEPWTVLEIDCADFIAQTEHGDQYRPRERLRMCRNYIEVNGGFGGRTE